MTPEQDLANALVGIAALRASLVTAMADRTAATATVAVRDATIVSLNAQLQAALNQTPSESVPIDLIDVGATTGGDYTP